MISEEHIKQLKEILSYYGAAKVVSEITNLSIVSCKTDYADNPGAIIHRDTVALIECCKMLGRNHPILGQHRL